MLKLGAADLAALLFVIEIYIFLSPFDSLPKASISQLFFSSICC